MNINDLSNGPSSDVLEISDMEYRRIIDVNSDVFKTFEEVEEIFKQINDDLEWKGEGRIKYDDTKAFIDQFMDDLPNLFEILFKEINDTYNILTDLFNEVSNTIKEFYDYE